MVGGQSGTVRLEIVPWLTQQFGAGGSSRLVLEEDIDGTVRLGDFLAALAAKHPAIGAAILDVGAGQLREHVNIVHNDTILGASVALEARVEAGDSLVLLPAFSGG